MATRTYVARWVSPLSLFWLDISGCVQTWCPNTVPKNDSWWALMWTHLFLKYPRQNSGTVPVPVPVPLVLGHWTGQINDISGTQYLNTAPFCAGARVLVRGHRIDYHCMKGQRIEIIHMSLISCIISFFVINFLFRIFWPSHFFFLDNFRDNRLLLYLFVCFVKESISTDMQTSLER